MLDRFGNWGLRFIMITLAVTPLRRLTGWNWLTRFRRMLGLFAFFYASLHFATYLWLDQFFAWGFIWEDVTERPFIIAGTVAFLLILPLALTSTRGWIRRLGRRWVQLHWLVYPAAGSALLHYVWKQKADFRGPIIAGIVLALLLGLRVWWRGRDKAARAARQESRSPTPEPQGQPG